MKDVLSYHAGELAVQTRAGVGAEGLAAGDMYRPSMPTGVQRFLAVQQLAILSTQDADGRLWASMRSGLPGFLRALDPTKVEIGGYSHPEDPLLKNLATPSLAGMLAIQLAARQRIRLNGTAQLRPDGKIILSTQQVYGNCPQYIQARAVTGEGPASAAVAQVGSRLDARLRRWIEEADTLFIATAHPESGADASHRGGRPGFVRVEDENRLLIPDYSGNRMFNTLGNLAANPRAGLLIPDFQSGAALQLSGRAQILWDDPRMLGFTGAQRLLAFDIERVIELPQATRLQFDFRGYSPTLP
jgi:predicted pyridoxine 5'-phosphate oxidase superfamily flavin-nucleotide-binding protein